jgi:hypothetical protein
VNIVSSRACVVVAVVWLSWLLPGSAYAQQRVYQTNLADEDWGFLKDQSKRQDWWDPIKYIPLGHDDWFITLSGEIRFRPEGFRIKATDTAPAVRDQYLLQRYLFGTDVHFGNQTRLYTELQSGIINGRIGASRPTDQNTLDLHQGFLEWKSSGTAAPGFDVKIGRQELTIGSSRLISAAPGLNVKRSFDGFRVAWVNRSWRFESAAAELTDLQPGVFDDGPAHQIKFWGVAARGPGQLLTGTWTVYYLGLENKDIQFAQGRGQDTRNTIGANWRGNNRMIDFNYDGIVQFGSFEGSRASAWGVSTETGIRVPKAAWRPRFGLRANGASGDRDANDPTLQSFNPLFPGASFAGPIGLFGPTNMIDVTPFVSVVPRRGLVLGFERPSYWRESTGDGIYNTALRLLVAPTAGTGRFIGGSTGIVVVWQATRHFQASGAIIRLVSGHFLDTTVVRGGAGLYSATATYRF